MGPEKNAAGLPATPSAPPTRARFGVLAFLGSLCFVLYIDRHCMGKAAPYIQSEFGISNTAWGFVLNAFLVAYGIFEVPTGRWGDRYGSRGVLLRIVLWWSAFTMMTAWVWHFAWDSGWRLPVPGTGWEVPLLFNSFLLLLVVRFLFGAGEAGALPNMARVISRWFPADRRGPAQGLINTAMMIGGAVAPVTAAYLIEGVGWRWTFIIFGCLGIVWAAAFDEWFHDDPREHPAVNEAELRLITQGNAQSDPPAHHPPIPWGLVLTSPNVWLMGGVISCSAFSAYINYSWYPTYLEKGRGLTNIQAGWWSSLVLTGGAVGGVLGGYLGDWLYRRTGERRWTRRLLASSGLALASALLVLSVRMERAELTSGFAALAALCTGTTLASWWGVVSDISGKHVGALFGLMNSMGVFGAFISQQFFGTLADILKARGYEGRAQWDPGFYVSAGVLFVGAVGWLFIDASKSAVEPDQAA